MFRAECLKRKKRIIYALKIYALEADEDLGCFFFKYVLLKVVRQLIYLTFVTASLLRQPYWELSAWMAFGL